MFSSAVKIGDLDDYLTPSQDCVKPILEEKTSKKKNAPPPPKAEEVRPNLIRSDKNSTKAKVNLVDCLACSGCVTSAESMLIEQQGVGEFLQMAKDSALCAVSLSPQSVASLSQFYHLSPDAVKGRLSTLFRRAGAALVFDMEISDAISRVSFYEDYRSRCERYFHGGDETALPLITSHCPGWICYAEKNLHQKILNQISTVLPSQETQGLLVKFFASRQENEKRIKNSSIRLLSRFTPSLFVKKYSKNQQNLVNPHQIYHTVLQPCFDKKLEAIRPEFVLPTGGRLRREEEEREEREDGEEVGEGEEREGEGEGEREKETAKIKLVDCVLATLEIQNLMIDLGVEDFCSLDETPLDVLPFEFADIARVGGEINVEEEEREEKRGASRVGGYFSGNGGFLEYSVLNRNGEKFAEGDQSPMLVKRRLKNRETVELATQGHENFMDLKYVSVSGFKNIQNVVRSLFATEKNQKKHHPILVPSTPFLPVSSEETPVEEGEKPIANNPNTPIGIIEFLACPGGCYLGGGQIFEETANGRYLSVSEGERILREMETAMSLEQNANSRHLSYRSIKFYIDFLISHLLDESATSHHAVAELNNALKLMYICVKANETSSAQLKW